MYRSCDAVSARKLAETFGVSRQVIVQDIAILRSYGNAIVSTNRGYILPKSARFTREFKVCHDMGRVIQELNIIVDLGVRVKNVSISHRVYGRISAEMRIDSRADAREYVERMQSSKSTILGNSTSGYHYHLVEASSEERLDEIEETLEKEGFLVPYLSWEKKQFGEES